MAGAAVLRDALAIAGRVGAVVTTKAPGEVRVSQIIWIGSPGNFQFWKRVAAVDRKNGLARLTDIFRTLCGEVGIVLLIKTSKGQRYLSGCFLLRGIGLLQHCHPLFFHEGQSYCNLSQSEGSVHRALGQFKSVRWSVVAVNALHFELRQGVERIALRTSANKRSNLTRLGVAIFNPRDRLALRIRCREADVNA